MLVFSIMESYARFRFWTFIFSVFKLNVDSLLYVEDLRFVFIKQSLYSLPGPKCE
jgi:hypothetical protein